MDEDIRTFRCHCGDEIEIDYNKIFIHMILCKYCKRFGCYDEVTDETVND